MGQAKSSWTKTFGIDRREACKKIPCAAVGALVASGLTGSAPKAAAAESTSGELFSMQEDAMPNQVTVEVISQKGTCAMGHKVGDMIYFAEKEIDGQICIHALYAILPMVFAMMYDARFPWLEDPDVSTSACPDAANPVVFEISRKKAGGSRA